MSNISVKVDVDMDGITKRIEDIIHDEGVMTEVHEAYAEVLNPYVPYDTGYLSQDSVEVSAEGVTYTADYAWKQYYGTEYNHKKEVHPLATAMWDKVAMQTEKEAFAETVKEIIVRRLNGG